MSKKRTLTGEEIHQIREYLQRREKAKYADHIITIAVKKETNDDGIPSAVITRIRETEEDVGEY